VLGGPAGAERSEHPRISIVESHGGIKIPEGARVDVTDACGQPNVA